MKKLAIFLSILVVAVAAASCGQKKEEGIASKITISGVELALGAEFAADKAEALGTPQEVVQAPSCHYDGSDSIYTYQGFSLYTYMQEDKAILYSVEITDAGLTTPEGAKTGMTRAEIQQIYGDAYEDAPAGIAYSIRDGMTLTFRLTEDTVSLIEYYAE